MQICLLFIPKCAWTFDKAMKNAQNKLNFFFMRHQKVYDIEEAKFPWRGREEKRSQAGNDYHHITRLSLIKKREIRHRGEGAGRNFIRVDLNFPLGSLNWIFPVISISFFPHHSSSTAFFMHAIKFTFLCHPRLNIKVMRIFFHLFSKINFHVVKEFFSIKFASKFQHERREKALTSWVMNLLKSEAFSRSCLLHDQLCCRQQKKREAKSQNKGRTQRRDLSEIFPSRSFQVFRVLCFINLTEMEEFAKSLVEGSRW